MPHLRPPEKGDRISIAFICAEVAKVVMNLLENVFPQRYSPFKTSHWDVNEVQVRSGVHLEDPIGNVVVLARFGGVQSSLVERVFAECLEHCWLELADQL